MLQLQLSLTMVYFEEFLKPQGVMFQEKIAPYHPATNDLARRVLQTVKNGLKYMKTTIHNLELHTTQQLMI